MRQIIRLTLALTLLASATAHGAEYVKDPVYNYGERAVFNLYYNWGFIWIHAGDCTFKVQEKDYNGKPTYAILVAGNSTPTFDKMYCIRDSFESYIDTETLKPVYYVESKHEDSFYQHVNYYYYERPDDMEVLMKKLRKTKRSEKTFTMDKETVDLIAACYKFRNLDADKLKENETVPFKMLFDDDIYDLGLTYKGKTEIKLRNGKRYRALVFMPKLITGGLFEDEDDMVIYVSDDANHVPLQINCKIKVGYVKAILSSVSHTKFPMTSELKAKTKSKANKKKAAE